jgi:adenylate kinase
MRIILFGPPGVGKGTQAQLLASKYHMLRLSSGDLLREEVSLNSQVGRKVEQYLRKGHLVPDDIMFEIVDNMLIENQDNDILFDGFPRNLAQARNLEKSLAQLDQTVDIAFEMHLDENEIIKRLMNRRYCPKCGRIYNYVTNPPTSDGVCDFDKLKLTKRDDDTEQVIKQRLKIYETETRPMISYYETLNVYKEVNAQGTQEEVLTRISEIVDDYLTSKCRSN